VKGTPVRPRSCELAGEWGTVGPLNAIVLPAEVSSVYEVVAWLKVSQILFEVSESECICWIV